MATPNRAMLVNRLHKVLKKHYEVGSLNYHLPPADGEKELREEHEPPVLEAVLFACCLENAKVEAARQAFLNLRKSFFDWNEVRVSAIKELGEAMHFLPAPEASAKNLRAVLQTVFEDCYSFDLQGLKKLAVLKAMEKLKRLRATPFAMAYAKQMALGGHAIPIDRGLWGALTVLGLATPKDEASSAGVLDNSVSKNKGKEVAALVHRLGAEFADNPYSPALHKLLMEIEPSAKGRLPKRPPKSRSGEGPTPAAKESTGPAAAPPADTSRPKAAAKPARRGDTSTNGIAEGTSAPEKKKSIAGAKKPTRHEREKPEKPGKPGKQRSAKPADSSTKKPSSRRAASVGSAKPKPR